MREKQKKKSVKIISLFLQNTSLILMMVLMITKLMLRDAVSWLLLLEIRGNFSKFT